MTKFKSYRSSKTEVKKRSKIQGKGLFAKEGIKKDELIFIKAGHIVDYKTHVAIEKKFGEYCLQITDRLYLCPTSKQEVKDTAIFINHSCNPNVGADGQISFIALRDIKVGEEITIDYAMTTDRQYKLTCFCGSKNCRKIITGKDWKKKDLQKKYENHFTTHIFKKIKEFNR